MTPTYPLPQAHDAPREADGACSQHRPTFRPVNPHGQSPCMPRRRAPPPDALALIADTHDVLHNPNRRVTREEVRRATKAICAPDPAAIDARTADFARPLESSHGH